MQKVMWRIGANVAYSSPWSQREEGVVKGLRNGEHEKLDIMTERLVERISNLDLTCHDVPSCLTRFGRFWTYSWIKNIILFPPGSIMILSRAVFSPRNLFFTYKTGSKISTMSATNFLPCSDTNTTPTSSREPPAWHCPVSVPPTR